MKMLRFRETDSLGIIPSPLPGSPVLAGCSGNEREEHHTLSVWGWLAEWKGEVVDRIGGLEQYQNTLDPLVCWKGKLNYPAMKDSPICAVWDDWNDESIPINHPESIWAPLRLRGSLRTWCTRWILRFEAFWSLQLVYINWPHFFVGS